MKKPWSAAESDLKKIIATQTKQIISLQKQQSKILVKDKENIQKI